MNELKSLAIRIIPNAHPPILKIASSGLTLLFCFIFLLLLLSFNNS
nr:MAG TPA: hypothetical protein [Caudoviricetes sp.]